jgi:two-component sensor histidine kinase
LTNNQPDILSLGEARHRIANVFQLLTTLCRLRAQRGDDAEARRQLEWMHEAISALGVLQRRQLSPQGDDFSLFLQDMAAHWRRKASKLAVDVQLSTEPLILPESLAAALAIIVQELIANALAHGFPTGRAGSVRVTLERLDGARAALSVSDDGVGYAPDAVDPRRLGLWLIGGLANQAQATLTMRCEGGVRARLEFPL